MVSQRSDCYNDEETKKHTFGLYLVSRIRLTQSPGLLKIIIMYQDVLYVTDSRTSLDYQIPIQRNTVKATDFQAIKGPINGSDPADQVKNGLRIFDPGFKNTAISESKITFMFVSP